MKKVFTISKWIANDAFSFEKQNPKYSPAVQMRKVFFIENSIVKKAICRICGLGCFILFINGKRVGDDIMSPAFSAYDKRTYYVEYEVSKFLHHGNNLIAVKLGNGFYNQTTNDTWGFNKAPWRSVVKLLFELVIDNKIACVSDTSWKTTDDGSTIHNAIRTGEFYDARKEDDWKESVEYEDKNWNNALISSPPGGIIEKMKIQPIRECEYLKAINIFQSKLGWIFDFGKNVAGYASINMHGKKGNTISLKYAERLKEGELDTSTVDLWIFGDVEFAVDKYTFRGEKSEKWKPQFAYHGFRYVEIVGVENKPNIDDITACFVHTDLKNKASFKCSNELYNWIYDAGNRSFLSNYHGIPTDCPHREKNGWTGDAAISCDYAVALYDMREAYYKWIKDFIDAQRENGQIPGIIPTSGWGYNWGAGPAWDIALFYLPFKLFEETGDTKCLKLMYSAAKKYIFYSENYLQEGLVCYGLSDWCPPDNIQDIKIMNNELSDSCYYYEMLMIMCSIAKTLNKISDSKLYFDKAENVKKAIIKKYIHQDNVDNNSQGALSIVLYFHICDGKQAKAIAEKLVSVIKNDNYSLRVGILGMKAMLNALTEYGYNDVACQILNGKEYPSYGYCKDQGATTLWENWDGSGSMNHCMYSDVVNWLFRNIGGIQNMKDAYNECRLKPYFFDENCFAKSSIETVKGKIVFNWEKKKNIFVADIVIPENVNAILSIGKDNISVKTGKIQIKL